MPVRNSLSTAWPDGPVGRVAAPLREQVIEALTQAILNNRLKAGQRLVERELIEQLGVSRTTVREALRELASQGLVTVVPQKGAIVSSPTLEDARDLYEVRASLESLIVGRFVERSSDEQVARLAKAVEHFAQKVGETDDVHNILESKSEFYDVLVEGAGSAVFRELVERIQARVQLLRATSLSEKGRSQEAVEELRNIVRAIAARDAQTAAALCAAHIRAASRTALLQLEADDAEEMAV